MEKHFFKIFILSPRRLHHLTSMGQVLEKHMGHQEADPPAAEPWGLAGTPPHLFPPGLVTSQHEPPGGLPS